MYIQGISQLSRGTLSGHIMTWIASVHDWLLWSGPCLNCLILSKSSILSAKNWDKLIV